jgi:TRAP-type C4-dicarboxylate transport system permease small subunit
MKSLTTIVNRGWLIASLIALVGVVLVTGVGTLSRTFETNKFAWSFEVVGIAFIWITALGTVLAEGAKENVAIDLLDRALTSRKQRILAVIRNIITTFILLALLKSGFVMLEKTAFNPTPVMRLPMWVMHGSIIALAVGIIAVQFHQAVQSIRGVK